jgi:hypothetical protein
MCLQLYHLHKNSRAQSQKAGHDFQPLSLQTRPLLIWKKKIFDYGEGLKLHVLAALSSLKGISLDMGDGSREC